MLPKNCPKTQELFQNARETPLNFPAYLMAVNHGEVHKKEPALVRSNTILVDPPSTFDPYVLYGWSLSYIL